MCIRAGTLRLAAFVSFRGALNRMHVYTRLLIAVN